VRCFGVPQEHNEVAASLRQLERMITVELKVLYSDYFMTNSQQLERTITVVERMFCFTDWSFNRQHRLSMHFPHRILRVVFLGVSK